MPERLRTAVVLLDGTLRDALVSLDKSGFEIVLVTDSREKLVGIMTHGDIRRALLQNGTLEAPLIDYICRDFIAVGSEVKRAEVMDLMQARWISQIPIVDEDKHLIGLHTLHGILGAVDRPNWAVIMAGGRGVRLRPLTDKIPKPMLKIAGRPILERLILHLVGYGIQRIFLAVNYKAEVIRDHFGNGEVFGCRIDYLEENEPLGTGGALSLLPESPRHPFLVLNGDLVTQFNVAHLLSLHDTQKNVATMGVGQYIHEVPYGVVEVREGRVIALDEKPAAKWLINAGIYVLNPDVLDLVVSEERRSMPEIVEGLLKRKRKVGMMVVDEEWIDVGQVSHLKMARGEEP